MRIWTDDEYIDVEPNDVGQLEAAMLFKAEHTKAKADPELFAAVADMLSRLWDSATKRVDVVRCREGKQGEIDDPDFPDQYYCHAGCGWNNGGFYCAYGERKEGADNG